MTLLTFDEFVNKYNGKKLDEDGAYGDQCVDVAKAYCLEVLGVIPLVGNAINWSTQYDRNLFNWTLNTPVNAPQKGDIVVWGKVVGRYGHIDVCYSSNLQTFDGFDQNWPLSVDANGNGTGVCHIQNHNYNGVLGWLRVKNPPSAIITPAMPIVTPSSVANLQPMRQVVLDCLQALTGQSPSDDQINSYLDKQFNTQQVIEDICSGNGAFFDKWIKPRIPVPVPVTNTTNNTTVTPEPVVSPPNASQEASPPITTNILTVILGWLKKVLGGNA